MRIAIVALLLILATLSFAEDYVVINSLDGRDVLSGVYYANAKGLPVKFMPYPISDVSLVTNAVGSDHDILLIQGAIPVSGLLESALRTNGNTVELYQSEDGLSTNFDLAQRSGATHFVVVDSAFSDSALSALPFAAMSDSYVVLADKNHAEDVFDAVSGADVTIYGYVDQDVRDALAPLNPKTIGKGEDKYEDNVVLVGDMMDEYSSNRIIMTDGSFIEGSMASGAMPLLLTGRIVPAVTYDFVKDKMRSGQLKEVLLIGNDPGSSLVTPIYDMRERMEVELLNEEGLNKSFLITVKFGQVIPGVTGPLALDTFPLPAYKPDLNLSDVIYNLESKSVMVTVDNLGEGAAYYTLELRVMVDGVDYTVLTMAEPRLVEREDSDGVEFSLDLSSVPEGDISVLAVAKYGSSKNSLEDFSQYSGELTTISFVDQSDVGVSSAKYDREQKTLLVTYRNKGAETVYVSSKAQLVVDGFLTNVSSPAVREMEAGSLFVEQFPLELSEADISANKNTTLFLKYGARKGFLKKEGAFTLPLEESGFPVLYLGLILIVLLIVGYYLYSRKNAQKR